MARDEVERLVDDVAAAVASSSLRSLLRGEGPGSARLARLPAAALDAAVRPVRAVLEGIDAGRLLDLELFRERPPPRGRDGPSGPRVRDGVYCRPISDRIEPALDDDDYCDGTSVVRYLHVAEVPDAYTVGVFVFGPRERIPLHDHPGMCVLSRVLYGDLTRLSLDLARDLDDDGDDEGDGEGDDGEGDAADGSSALSSRSEPRTQCDGGPPSSSLLATALSRSATWLQKNLYGSGRGTPHSGHRSPGRYPEGSKLAFRNAGDVLAAPAVTVLYPYEGNLHEFAAGPHGAAVLDVLLPPYGDERDCTYYNIRELPAASAPPGGRERCLVVPTGWPEDFHCVSGRYHPLGDGAGDDDDDYDSDDYDRDDGDPYDSEE